MSRLTRVVTVALGTAALIAAVTIAASAQRRGVPRRPPPPPQHGAVVLRGQVFIGGYFYDPYWGPYPWWPRTAYPYWYFPRYDRRADLHVKVKPSDAAVYVDGFYAGIVDDFDGVFQSLPLTPGGHTITLYLEGYRTSHHNLYLAPASSIDLRETMQRLPPGVRSELPSVLPPIPPPPDGSYTLPRQAPTVTVTPPPAPAATAVSFGTLDLRIQPADALVTLDGSPWETTVAGHFVIQMPAGAHRVRIEKLGFVPYESTLDISDGQTTPINVSLMRAD